VNIERAHIRGSNAGVILADCIVAERGNAGVRRSLDLMIRRNALRQKDSHGPIR